MQPSRLTTSRLQKLETETRRTLAELSQRVRRLSPDHRDPHRFHEEKSEIAHELNRLARRPAL